MKIVNTTCDKLNKKTLSRIEDRVLSGPARPNSRVFLAKSGNRTVGVAVVEHENYGTERDLFVYMDASSGKTEEALRNKVKQNTKHLKRRTVFV